MVIADVLTKFVASRLASYKTPEKIVVLDDLPKNMAGEVHCRTLRTTYLDGSHKRAAANAGPR